VLTTKRNPEKPKRKEGGSYQQRRMLLKHLTLRLKEFSRRGIFMKP
jgi:hypothetical protein